MAFIFQKRSSVAVSLINAIGPLWDANQVWLIIGGVHYLLDSRNVCYHVISHVHSLYAFLMLLVLRSAAIKFRSAEEMKWWRKTWDIIYFTSNTLIAFLLGVVLGNVFKVLK
jgi:cytochrome d ubiquinol oxidase subunit II